MTRQGTPSDDTASGGLAAFLRARLQDDWNHARDAMMDDGVWRAERTVVVLNNGGEIPEVYLGIADHIARFDPARVFADVEAGRAVVDAFDGARSADTAGDAYFDGVRDAFRHAVGLLAERYDRHPDFRPEWRVT